MNDFTNFLEKLLPVVGQKGVDAIEAKLKGLSEGADSGWKKAALALVADAVEKHGPAGIKMATQAIQDLLDGSAPNIDWADLEVASNILAQMENAEADKKDSTRKFLAEVSEVLGVILAGIIKGLL